MIIQGQVYHSRRVCVAQGPKRFALEHHPPFKQIHAYLQELTQEFIKRLYCKPSVSTTVTLSLTPRCTVLLEKLTGLQLVKEFPAFHRTRRFITALTSVRHLSLSWASPIQSIYPHPTSWRSILILSNPSMPRSPQRHLSLRFMHHNYKSTTGPISKLCREVQKS